MEIYVEAIALLKCKRDDYNTPVTILYCRCILLCGSVHDYHVVYMVTIADSHDTKENVSTDPTKIPQPGIQYIYHT